jgi:hypothetical protein
MSDGGGRPGSRTRPDDADEPVAVTSPPLRSRTEALRNVRGANKEVTSSGPDPGSEGPGGDFGERTLSHLLRFHPLMSYFCWLADRQFPASHRSTTRVSRLRERNPRFYWVCVIVDTLFVILATIGLFVAAGAALYKTIWL